MYKMPEQTSEAVARRERAERGHERKQVLGGIPRSVKVVLKVSAIIPGEMRCH